MQAQEIKLAGYESRIHVCTSSLHDLNEMPCTLQYIMLCLANFLSIAFSFHELFMVPCFFWSFSVLAICDSPILEILTNLRQFVPI